MQVKDLIVTGDAKILGNLYTKDGNVGAGGTALSSEYAPISHNQAASTITAGTLAGQVVANSSGQTWSTYCLRNTRLASTDTNPTVNGEICWTYK